MNMQPMKLNNIQTGFKRILLTVAAVFMLGNGWAQDAKVLKGRIVNAEGEPIAGAVVNVAEASRIALSDKDGFFTLKNVKPADELYVSSVGYLPATAIADFEENFKIVMDADLDEYAHTTPLPFNRKPKKFVTESTSIVTGEELEKHPVTVLQNAFTSTVTGVETYEAQSEPGWSETAMYIRGIRTMNASARSPLIIVDNVERDLSFLDAYPIESITILKDAAATAIYGMRGANGAVLVTTKRGETGKTKINFTQEVGFQTIAGIPESQNSYNYALSRNQARYLDGLSPEYSDEDLDYYRRVCNGEQLEGMAKYKYFNTNWHDTMLRDAAPQYRTNLSVSGGNARARYYVSFSYLRQEGLFDTKWTEWNEGYSTQEVLNRYNLRSNIDIDVNKFLNVSMDLGGRIDNISQPGIDVWNLFTWGAGENLPVYPVFCPNGEFFMPTSSDSKNGAAQIAGRGVEQNRRRNLYTTVTATGNLDALVPGLKAKMTFSFDSYETFQKVQQADVNVYYYNYMADVNDPSEYTYQRMRTYKALPNATTSPRDYYYNLNMNGGLAYEHTFGKHAVNAQAFIRTYQNVVRGQESSNRYLSYNAQATYVYNNRYILSGNISRMGSDNYADGERFGTFPGGSVGWVLSEESWLKNSFVNLLKLRASYGLLGNQAGAALYTFAATMDLNDKLGNYIFSDGRHIFTKAPAVVNPNTTWEKVESKNIGLDFGFFGNSLTGSFDVFQRDTKDMLGPTVDFPDFFGADAPKTNNARMRNRGWELVLNYRGKIGKDIDYSIGGSLSDATAEVTEYEGTRTNPKDNWYKGKKAGEIWGYRADGLIQTQAEADEYNNTYDLSFISGKPWTPGDVKYRDLNGDKKINNGLNTLDDMGDMTVIGNTTPRYQYTINGSISWKGVTVSAMFQGVAKRDWDPGTGAYFWGSGPYAQVTVFKEHLDYWSETNTGAYYPKPYIHTAGGVVPFRNKTMTLSDRYLQSGAYCRLKNLTVSYDIPAVWTKKVGLQKVQVFFSGENLLTFTTLKGMFDPEAIFTKNDYTAEGGKNYPMNKVISFGLVVNL